MNYKGVNFRGILVLLIIVLCLPGMAQETQGKKKIYGGCGYFMGGWQGLNLDAINNAFTASGIPVLSNNMATTGGGGHAFFGRFILGGEGHGLFAQENTNAEYTTGISGGYGMVNVGYLLFQRGGLMVYPIVGLGGGGLDYTIRENRSTYDFNDITEDPAVGFHASMGGFLLNGQVGIDYHLNFSGDPNERGGMLVGIRGGYNWAPSKTWEYNGSVIANHPERGFQGFYLKVIIGGGGFSVAN